MTTTRASAAEPLRSLGIDPAVLGLRIRAARTAAGLTQTELARPYTSAAYVSRIESGQRRPNMLLLRRIAARVDLTVDELLFENAPDEGHVELRLRLAWARRRLAEGEYDEGGAEARAIAQEAEALGLRALTLDAHCAVGGAEAAAGRWAQAVVILQGVLDEAGPAGTPTQAFADLATALQGLGDHTRAAEIAETGAGVLEADGRDVLSEALDLALVRARSYAELGRWTQAEEVCAEALRRGAESEVVPRLEAAHWDASAAARKRGTYDRAWRHAERAAALHELGGYRNRRQLLDELRERAAVRRA